MAPAASRPSAQAAREAEHRDLGLLAAAAPIELWVLHADYKTLTLPFTPGQLLSPTPDPKEITLFPRR